MRIAVLTLFPSANYGCCLQSLALTRVLEQMGCEVELLHRDERLDRFDDSIRSLGARLHLCLPPQPAPRFPDEPRRLELPNHPFWALLSRFPGYNAVWRLMARRHSMQRRRWENFAYNEGNYRLRTVHTAWGCRRASRDFDLLLTGSDQVWNPWCRGFDALMFAEFGLPGQRRAAYSAGIVLDSLPEALRERMRRDLELYDHIALRERSAVRPLNELLQRSDVRSVVDPVLLVGPEEWRSFGRTAELPAGLPVRYVLCYFTDSRPHYARLVSAAQKAYPGLPMLTLSVGGKQAPWGDGLAYPEAGPREWLRLLSEASCVVTNSFHATCLSLHLGRPLAVALKDGGRDPGDARLTDLLRRYNLERLIYQGTESVDALFGPIDSHGLRASLDRDIDDSLAFLKMVVGE